MTGMFYDSITDFIFVEDQPESADVIFVPGGNYPDAAKRAAGLYRSGYAPYIVLSGKYSITVGRLQTEDETYGKNFRTEADYLSAVLKAEGVPDSAVLAEDQAAYTYQNAVFSRKLLEEKKIPVQTAILCCQAFHARRSLLYYQEQFPKVRFLVCPVVTKGIGRDSWRRSEKGIDTVLGELERCGSQFHQIMRQYMQ